MVIAVSSRSFQLSKATDFRVLPGYGLSANVDGRLITIGTRNLLSERGIPWSTQLENLARTLELLGGTIVPVQ